MSGLGLTFLRRGNLAHPTAGVDKVRFADAEVERVLLANNLASNGEYITREDCEKITKIPAAWFRGNTNISSFTELRYFINLIQIEAHAFRGCSNLTKIDLPENLTTISMSAFQDTPLLRGSLYLPNLTELGGAAFYNSGIDEVLNVGKISTLYQSSEWQGSIQPGAFQNCANLKKVVLPNTLTNIKGLAFSGCTSLADISIPQNVVEIGADAFNGVPANMVIQLPQLASVGSTIFRASGVVEVQSLGVLSAFPTSNVWAAGKRGGMFIDCHSLRKCVMPSTWKSSVAMEFYNCSALEVVISNAVTPPSLSVDIFLKSGVANGTATIYVPDASVDAYKAAANWSTYANLIKPISEYQG